MQCGIEITGLPTRGICENFTNPFVVFTVLYDFFKVKGNLYLCNKSIISAVRILYKGFIYEDFRKRKKFTRILNINFSTYRKLEGFMCALDITFGYSTYDSLRKLLAYRISNDLYQLPTPTVVLEEYSRIVGDGLGTLIGNNIAKTLAIQKELLGKFDLEDLNDTRFYPIFQSILNYIRHM